MDYKKLKLNNAIELKKEDDKIIAVITAYSVYTGQKETKEEEVDVIRYENEKTMFEDQINAAQNELNTINLLLSDINNLK